MKARWEFDKVFRTGRQEKGRTVRLFFAPASGEPTRWGVVVGKKIAGATERVRGRRVLRECCRRLAPAVAPGHLIVLMLTPAGLEAKAPDLYAQVCRLLERAGVLNDVPADFNLSGHRA